MSCAGQKLIVGGLPRAFEIGRVFRNEGIDRTHNPEFTTCEFYQAYAPFSSLFDTTEALLRHIVAAVNGGSLTVTITPPELAQQPSSNSSNSNTGEEGASKEGARELDFSKPFQRLSFVDTIEQETGVRVVDTDTGQVLPLAELVALCEAHNVSVERPCTHASLLEGATPSTTYGS